VHLITDIAGNEKKGLTADERGFSRIGKMQDSGQLGVGLYSLAW